jgi:alkylhydroperoxidase/carboxymuconolactone decarboxylase family protein YurZ
VLANRASIPSANAPHVPSDSGPDNGLTSDEIIETITHLAFYTGWPNAVTALGLAKKLFADQRP